MEVISTSNLVSLKNEKTSACNFQTMAINFFVYATWFDERPNRKLFIYANMKQFVVLWWQNLCPKCPKKHKCKKH